MGAAAAAASLQQELVDPEGLSDAEFNEAYAVARLTPGTNLLALYTLLGRRLGGGPGAALALTAGTVIPSLIAVAIAAVYVGRAKDPVVAHIMQGARAGALAVFLWAAVRLTRPVFRQQGARAAIVAVVTACVFVTGLVPQFWLLVLGGIAGAAVLRSET